MKKLLSAVASMALVTVVAPASAQDAPKMVQAEAVAWKPHPLFPGAFTAIIYGNPGKSETIVQRNKFPPNFKVAPHHHSFVEVGTVLSGSLGQAVGDTFDPSKGEMLKAGGMFAVPAGKSHYMWTGSEEVVFQINFTGPATIAFQNPGDDPRKK